MDAPSVKRRNERFALATVLEFEEVGFTRSRNDGVQKGSQSTSRRERLMCVTGGQELRDHDYVVCRQDVAIVTVPESGRVCGEDLVAAYLLDQACTKVVNRDGLAGADPVRRLHPPGPALARTAWPVDDDLVEGHGVSLLAAGAS
ncbi:MAG: hypothetical protein QOH73_986 [Gaiellaceae bacterium]|nr:hypothetical protein [Gaiellaceae bacterium]